MMVPMMCADLSPRDSFVKRLHETRDSTVDILMKLLAVPSENPPGDTRRIAREIETMLSQVDGIETALVSAIPQIENVLAVVGNSATGRCLVLNGHIDTFEIGDEQQWSKNPLGEQAGCRIYGRGAADMKGGLAAQIFAAQRLAEVKQLWRGKLVLVLAGDEETGGANGTRYVLEQQPIANGDAMLCADAGSPHVLRFGEKGCLWITINASGKASHGAHVHLGVSAVDRLLHALAALNGIKNIEVLRDATIEASIDAAAPYSEEISGAGETETLRRITVNIGRITGGSVSNIVADSAQASVDIRLPLGVELAAAKRELSRLIGTLPGISYAIDIEAEPNATQPDHEIVKRMALVGEEVLGRKVVATMRVGASDSPHFRARGIPSVVCGLTPFNMGAPDEYVLTDELRALGEIYALAAFDYLSAVD